MRRWQFLLASAGVLLLIGWGLHKVGWLVGGRDGTLPGPINNIKTVDPMDTSSGWRYRQNQPHHWRYIVLQN
jgi:hypothetical protein